MLDELARDNDVERLLADVGRKNITQYECGRWDSTLSGGDPFCVGIDPGNAESSCRQHLADDPTAAAEIEGLSRARREHSFDEREPPALVRGSIFVVHLSGTDNSRLGQQRMKVAIVGAGYVGLASGLALAHVGHEVRILDVDTARIAALQRGEDPLGEDHIPALLRERRASFTTDPNEALTGADVIVIAVGTPPSKTGTADLSFLDRVAATVAAHNGGTTVLIRSTVPVGTCDRLQAGPLRAFQVVANPEFLREGRAIRDSLRPDRIVAGGDLAVERKVRALYAPILEGTFAPIDGLTSGPRPEMHWMDRRSAELAKYAANAFLATKLSFVNEMANLAAAVGADIRAVTRAVGADPRIGPAFLRPGIGWGGSCFPKDTRALAAFALESGYDFRVLRAVIEQNSDQLQRFFRLIEAELQSRGSRRVGLLGLAFKSGTSDCRESPAIALAEMMLDHGWEVRAFDPALRPGAPGVPATVTVVSRIEDAAAHADVLVVATEWDEFANADYAALARLMDGDALLDGRCIVDPTAARAAGLRYVGICAPELPRD